MPGADLASARKNFFFLAEAQWATKYLFSVAISFNYCYMVPSSQPPSAAPPAVPAPTGAPPAVLVFTLALLALAGFVDAIGFIRFKLYVSFMSGNTTALGAAGGRQDLGTAGNLTEVLVLFMLGVMGGTLLHRRTGAWGNTAVLLLVTGLILLAYAWPAGAMAILALAMGTLNATVRQIDQVKLISITAVTGTLVTFGTGLADWLTGQAEPKDWGWPIMLWLGFLVGALGGAAALVHLKELALLPVAGLALLMALVARRVHGVK